MPKVTIWIKNEDLDKWNAIADRPEWLHEHLNEIYYKEQKLSPSGVTAYEAMSGFKTTGDVTLITTNAFDELYKPTIDPTYTDMDDAV